MKKQELPGKQTCLPELQIYTSNAPFLTAHHVETTYTYTPFFTDNECDYLKESGDSASLIHSIHQFAR